MLTFAAGESPRLRHGASASVAGAEEIITYLKEQVCVCVCVCVLADIHSLVPRPLPVFKCCTYSIEELEVATDKLNCSRVVCSKIVTTLSRRDLTLMSS